MSSSTYNTTCSKCGSLAYQGFANLECSNSDCSHWDGKGGSWITPPPAVSLWPAPVPLTTSAIQTPRNASKFGNLSVSRAYLHFGVPLFNGTAFRWTNETRTISRQNLPGDSCYQAGIADSMLSLLKKHSTRAVIAGGFARDYYLDRQDKVADVDFYVEGFNKTSFAAAVLSNPYLSLNVTSQMTPAAGNVKYAAPSIFSVNDLSFGSGRCKTQIIECDSIDKNILQFDFGINMIMIDDLKTDYTKNELEVHYNYTKFFEDSHTQKKLIFYPDLIDPVRLKSLPKRKTKMLGKFPGWEIDIERHF